MASSSSTTTVTTLDEVTLLRMQVAQLTQENAVLLKLVPGHSTPAPTTPVPKVRVPGVGVKVEANKYEAVIMISVVLIMLFLWAFPMLKPFKRHFEHRIHRIFPVITVINLILFGVALDMCNYVQFNDLFFGVVKVVEIVIDNTLRVLIAFVALIVLVFLWKFKDRILETIGVDNPQMVIGEFRDWATCWSMKRFTPVEMYIWKVEGLPAVHLHQANDVFVQIDCGYNVSMKTRVHLRAGHTCTFKESMQFNFDRYDMDTRLYISVKNQDVLGSTDICSKQLGADQVYRSLEPHTLQPAQRTIGWGTTRGDTENTAWSESRFKAIDLIPAGRMWVRFQPVADEEAGAPSYGTGSSW